MEATPGWMEIETRDATTTTTTGDTKDFGEVVDRFSTTHEVRHYHPVQPAYRGRAFHRNERCPCGSGKKYKKCHGGSR